MMVEMLMEGTLEEMLQKADEQGDKTNQALAMPFSVLKEMKIDAMWFALHLLEEGNCVMLGSTSGDDSIVFTKEASRLVIAVKDGLVQRVDSAMTFKTKGRA